jgi:hypothetical protein
MKRTNPIVLTSRRKRYEPHVEAFIENITIAARKFIDRDGIYLPLKVFVTNDVIRIHLPRD